MIRAALEEGLLILLPFGVAAIALLVLRRNIAAAAAWRGLPYWLFVAGLALAILWTGAGAVLAPRHTGAFVPTHLEDGRVVPGGFR